MHKGRLPCQGSATASRPVLPDTEPTGSSHTSQPGLLDVSGLLRRRLERSMTGPIAASTERVRGAEQKPKTWHQHKAQTSSHLSTLGPWPTCNLPHTWSAHTHLPAAADTSLHPEVGTDHNYCPKLVTSLPGRLQCQPQQEQPAFSGQGPRAVTAATHGPLQLQGRLL